MTVKEKGQFYKASVKEIDGFLLIYGHWAGVLAISHSIYSLETNRAFGRMS